MKLIFNREFLGWVLIISAVYYFFDKVMPSAGSWGAETKRTVAYFIIAMVAITLAWLRINRKEG